MKRSRILTAAVAGVAIMVTATALPAAASTPDCSYPSVCLYQWNGEGWTKTGQLQQFTPGWQNLTVSNGATRIVNTRLDDVVYVLHRDGLMGCFPPDTDAAGEIAPIAAIRISSSPTCRL